jgi:Fur family peroxide stress response transcriptional regulator
MRKRLASQHFWYYIKTVMITNMKHIKSELEQKGIKPTYQRLCILEYLHEHLVHPTVEMIYDELIDRVPTMSKTTVYNTLKLLSGKGVVNEITITGTEVRYDINCKSHHHFLCKKCGKIYDIDVSCPFVNMDHKEVSGHEIQEIHGYFKGICKECLTKQNNE